MMDKHPKRPRDLNQLAPLAGHRFDCSDPLRRSVAQQSQGAMDLTPPILFRLPPQRLARRVLHLEPIRRAAER